jgi:hypothetical protein
MKKILSILLTVTMVFTFVASFRAPTASAAVTAITITDTNKTLDWFNSVPTFVAAGTLNTGTTYKVYLMGEVIHGTFTTDAGGAHKLYLLDSASTVLDTVEVTVPVAGTYAYTLGTGNVVKDGVYFVSIDTVAGGADLKVYIKYNIVTTTPTLQTCVGTNVVSGWITRGYGNPVTVPVDVYVTYPDNYLAGIYHVTPTSSGQFTITFQSDKDGDGVAEIGYFRLFVRDGYDPTYNPDFDAIIYAKFSNVPVITLDLSSYITPFLYKGVNSQPILLVLKDQNGNYVNSNVTWTVDGVAVTPAQISSGFYKFYVNVGTSQVDVRFVASYTPPWGGTAITDTLIVNTRDLGVYNPYIDLTAPDAISPYPDGTPWYLDSVESVYDKFPCTIGNSFEIMVNYYYPKDPVNWYINPDLSFWDITGPIEIIDTNFVGAFGDNIKVLVTGDGKISVSMSFVAWERANKGCPVWAVGVDGQWRYTDGIDPANACCHTFEKTVDICEVNSCTYGGVTLSGTNITDSTTVEVGKKVDKFSISIDPTGAPADLTCSCPNYVVLMYMTDSKGVILPKAFTVDTYSGVPATGGMIWYNPQGALGPNIKDQPIQSFKATGIYDNVDDLTATTGLKFGDCPFNLYGITFNYPTDTYCDYTLVVKVFGLERIFDACGTMIVKYPMIAEDFDPITVTPSITKLTATGTIWEGAMDPDQILAGISTVIDITDPGFTTTFGTPQWIFYLNGKKITSASGFPVPSYSSTGTGWRFSNICLNAAGTFKIYGYAYNSTCTKKEEVTLEFTVVVPEFTVEIGLMDGTKIPNDGILTEGFVENIYVTVTDPRGLHDFTNDDWDIAVDVEDNDCGLPPAVVCASDVAGVCCGREALAVSGYDNPCLEDDPIVDLYFVSPCGADILIDSFTLVPPTIKVDPKEVPFTIPASATRVTFTVTDAHGHGAPLVSVSISGVQFNSSSSGYGWNVPGGNYVSIPVGQLIDMIDGIDGPEDIPSNVTLAYLIPMASAGMTGKNGEVDWAFVPPYSGYYIVIANMPSGCPLPCGWYGIDGAALIEAKYQAPVVDTVKPVVEASAPAEVTSPMVTVSGKVTDNVGVVSLWIGAMKVDFAPDGTFSAKVEVAEGANTIKVVAFDAAGLMGDKTLTVTYAVPKVTVVKIQIGSDIMTVNGKAVQIDAPAEIVNGRTFLPLRAISEALGATVDWIAETQGITVTLGENTIGLQVGNTSAVVNGTVMTLDAAPYIKNSRTMVPFRVIAEGLGATVEWDPALRIVTVTLAQ